MPATRRHRWPLPPRPVRWRSPAAGRDIYGLVGIRIFARRLRDGWSGRAGLVEACAGGVGGHEGEDEENDPTDGGNEHEQIQQAAEVRVMQPAPGKRECRHDRGEATSSDRAALHLELRAYARRPQTESALGATGAGRSGFGCLRPLQVLLKEHRELRIVCAVHFELLAPCTSHDRGRQARVRGEKLVRV
jgi:hypothetical protein